MKGQLSLGAGMSDIMTRAELDQREAARARPAAGPKLEMNGSIGDQVRHEVSAENEARIRQIKERFGQVKEAGLAGHALGNLKGRAKYDFGH